MVTRIVQLKDSYGLTVLIAEQNFHQATRIADHGSIVVHGEIVFEGRSVAELEGNALVKNYYLGAEACASGTYRWGCSARSWGWPASSSPAAEPRRSSSSRRRSRKSVWRPARWSWRCCC